MFQKPHSLIALQSFPSYIKRNKSSFKRAHNPFSNTHKMEGSMAKVKCLEEMFGTTQLA